MARKKTTGTTPRSSETELDILLKSAPGRHLPLLLEKIGTLVELAGRMKNPEATEKALQWCAIAKRKRLDGVQRCLLDYYTASAWISRHHGRRTPSGRHWEQPEIEHAIFHLQKAVSDPAFPFLDELLRCKILTSLGNQFAVMGHFIRALTYWDRAIETDPAFGMALGNRGKGIAEYAELIADNGTKPVFLGAALENLLASTTDTARYFGDGQGKEYFRAEQEKIEAMLYNPDDETSLASATLAKSAKPGKGGKNRSERKWNLSNKLYLNPFNDLFSTPAAAFDLMDQPETVPSSLRRTPQAFRYLSQIRLEYVAARQLCYGSLNAKAIRKVKKNGLSVSENEPLAYSLAMESLKLSFRSAYSLLPKIAQVIKLYFNLKLADNKTGLKNVWYTDGHPANGLASVFTRSDNWLLRSLFWLSKELPSVRQLPSIDGASDRLKSIADALENRYLRVVELEPAEDAIVDNTISRDKLEKATTGTLSLVRDAIVYLTLALHIEEKKRKQNDRNNPESAEYASMQTSLNA